MQADSNGASVDVKTQSLTPLRLAQSISKRHGAAFKLLTGEQVATMRDGMRARAELPKVQERIAKLEAVLKVLDGIAGTNQEKAVPAS